MSGSEDGKAAAGRPDASVEQQLTVLYAIARAFAETDRLEDAAGLVVRALGSALGWEVAALWVVDGPALRCAAIHVTDNRLAAWRADALSRTFAREHGLPGHVWSSGEGIWVSDTDVDERFARRDLAHQVGLRHGFAFPVRVRGEVAAVVELFAGAVRQPDEAHSTFLEAVGHQLGSFIERIEARDAVALSEARKTGILRAAVDAIVSTDGHGHIVEFNPAAEQLFGRTRAEVLGRTVADMLVPGDLVAQHQAGMERYRATRKPRIMGQRVRTFAKRADGSRLPIELTVTEVRPDDEPMFTAFIRDITREREAETARDRFLEILSHELRTPVTALYGGAKVLSRGDLDTAGRRAYLDDMAHEADRLYRLIEDLIVLARAERGALSISLEPVRLERVAERVVKQFAERSPELDFRVTVDGYAPPVAADETYVEQLLRNLLSNAVKYGASGAEVDVRIEHADGESLVRVLDRGIGFDPAEVKQLFEIDFRSPLSEGIAQGSGIGLFVARWLAEGMGGRVWADQREGGGSEFGFALRVVDADSPGSGQPPLGEPDTLAPLG